MLFSKEGVPISIAGSAVEQDDAMFFSSVSLGVVPARLSRLLDRMACAAEEVGEDKYDDAADELQGLKKEYSIRGVGDSTGDPAEDAAIGGIGASGGYRIYGEDSDDSDD